MDEDTIIYTAEELLWNLWEDFNCFANTEESTFEKWVGEEIYSIKANSKYRTDSMLSYFEEIEDTKKPLTANE